MKIGLLSDTHGYLDDRIIHYLTGCDEIWHAGDIGTLEVAEKLQKIKPLRAVHGNIDGGVLRHTFPLHDRFSCEGKDVWLTHVGGYPGKYAPYIRDMIKKNPPDIFICGHSHILKVMKDPKLGLFHINPGAAGKSGIHKVRTMILMEIAGGNISSLQAVELGQRGVI